MDCSVDLFDDGTIALTSKEENLDLAKPQSTEEPISQTVIERTNRRKPRKPQKMKKNNRDQIETSSSSNNSQEVPRMYYTMSSSSTDDDDDVENISTVKLEVDGNEDVRVNDNGETGNDPPTEDKQSKTTKIQCEICGREFAKRYMANHLRSHANKKTTAITKKRVVKEKSPTPQRRQPARQSGKLILKEDNDDDDDEEDEDDVEVEDIEEESDEDYDSDEGQRSLPMSKRKLYSCYVCDRSFPKRLMATHLRSHNAAVKKYPCYVCDRPFTKEAMAAHLRTHNNDVKIDEENGEEEEVEDDGDEKDSDASVTVDVDNGSSRRNSSAKRKFKRIPCDICSKMYRKDYLAEHKKIHTRDKPFRCSECDEKPTFASLSELKSHNAASHGDRAIECDVCQKMFASKASLRQHKSTHSDEKRFQCEVCGKSFKQSSQYCNHMKTHLEGMPYQCEECGRRYKSVTGLIRHRERHHKGIRHSYPCELCGKTFTRRGKLKDHMMWHKGTSPYICQYCGKRLMSRKTLKTHELIHQDKKPYKCTVCSKSFRQNCVLKRHMSVHTGIKPFCCDLCGKQFIHRVYLVKHVCEMQDMNRTFLTL